MKKTLIASAVAAAALSSNAFAMDHAEKLDLMPTIYGNIQLVNNTNDDSIADDTTTTFDDNGSTLGFKHEHEIAAGITGFFKAELEFDADDKKDNSGLSGFDEAFIGVKGDFGSVQAGSDDTVAEDFDVMDFEEYAGIGTGNLVGMSEGDNIQYRTPDMNGLSAGLTYKADQKSTDEVVAALSVGYAADAFSATLSYAMAGDDFELVDGDGNATGVYADGEDAFGLGGTFAIEDLTLMASYEDKDKASYIAVGALYAMGAAQFAAQYGMGDNGESGAAEQTVDEFYLQALYNISDNMYTYIEYVQSETETNSVTTADTSDVSIGATYYF
ncbi:MAG: porin [Oleiphilaceae bacterium]|nr:porin [Oleiphilaceae bacterium]